MLSDAEIIAQIEELIQGTFRIYRNMPNHPSHQTYLALKAVAKDLQQRGDLPVILADLDRKIRGMEAARWPDGNFPPSHIREVALEVRAKWPAIRRAVAVLENKS